MVDGIFTQQHNDDPVTMMLRDPLSVAARVFSDVTFSSLDIGPLHEALDIDYFVISIPKCATTAIQRGLERLGRKVIKAHTNESTYAAFANGDVLRKNGLSMENVLKARLAANTRPIYIFFGYREPVSWYLSLASQFRIPFHKLPINRIDIDVISEMPWSGYNINATAHIVFNATGVRIIDHPFDPEIGYTLIKSGNVNIVVYRFGILREIFSFIAKNIDQRFLLTYERVNEDPFYSLYKSTIRLAPDELEWIDKDPWYKHFYTPLERNELMRRYDRRT
jgi:hypothetical protein